MYRLKNIYSLQMCMSVMMSVNIFEDGTDLTRGWDSHVQVGITLVSASPSFIEMKELDRVSNPDN